MQIRTRLTMLYLLNAAGILAGVLLAAYGIYQTRTEEAFYDGLRSKMEMTVQTALRNPTGLRALPPRWLAPEDDTLPYRDNISLFNNSYERVFAVHPDMAPISVKVLQDIYTKNEVRFRHYNLRGLGRLITQPDDRPYAVVVEGYCDPTGLNDLAKVLVISFLGGMALMALSGWYFAGQALAPVSRMMQEVQSLEPSDLSRRVVIGGNHDELSRLAATFNSLLDRVEQAFRMQRLFLSNVSHELKNPLTAIRTQLDVTLQRDRDPAAYRRTLQSILEDVNTMADVEENLLQLARIYNAPASIPLVPVRLDELLWQAKETLQKSHPDYKIVLNYGTMPNAEADLWVQANEPLLRTALLNLLDNGCKYSPDHQVQVSAHFRTGGAPEVEVRNGGPGIPADELPLLFEPFFRSPRHLALGGTGIGLSLVKSILTLHNIALTAHSPPEGGAVFHLVFPKP